ncbi:MAG: ankyrin repeat domain-containing protein [Candidatus Eremiobacteraeota bacterium]|nr:ankyrin repeat domain-containing protein [Candidatus Eremiobacteraeota bacterium]
MAQLLPDGTVVNGRYKVLRFLGEGGMNRVYLVEGPQGITFAMKVTKSGQETGAPGSETTDKFYREVEILTRFPHHMLPALEDYFVSGGLFFLIEEYIEGSSLEEYLENSLLSEDEAIGLALRLCDALAFLHGHGIIFRDLKPANLVVMASGELKLIDFDIARFFKEGKAADTIALGTPGYAAPETYGKSQSDARSDIYSLGATLHHLITGIDPQDSPFQFEAAHRVRSDISPGFGEVIQRALRLNPFERFQSAASMKKALLRLRPSSSTAPSSLEGLLAAAATWVSRIGQWGQSAVEKLNLSQMLPRLMEAVREGDIAEAKRLIEAGCPVDGCDSFQRTPLHAAIEGGDRPMVELLLNKGARLSLRSSGGLTPRDQAFLSGKPDIEKILRDRQAPLNIYDESGMMKVHKLVTEGDYRIMSLLPELGLFINTRDEQGRTPLHYAVLNNRYGLVTGLILSGATLDLQDHEGATPLHLLQSVQMLQTIRDTGVRLDSGLLEMGDHEGGTPLHHAVARGDIVLVKLLLHCGAFINCLNGKKESLLHGAIREHCSGSMVKFLIGRGINVNIKDSAGRTPLMTAIECEQWAVAEMLIDSRAFTNTDDCSGKTPLILAVEKDNAVFAEKLLRKSALARRGDHSGMTPLHYAAAHNSEDMVRLLLEFGADSRSLDDLGRTPGMLASGEVAALLGKAGSKPGEA